MYTVRKFRTVPKVVRYVVEIKTSRNCNYIEYIYNL